MRFPGPVVVYGIVAFGPLVAVFMGVRLIRAKKEPLLREQY
jgi:hypothetical protein